MKEPALGLVCLTVSDAVHYRTITRTRLLQLEDERRPIVLRALYFENVARLRRGLLFCMRNAIRLYRIPTGLLPFSDHEIGRGLLDNVELREAIHAVGTFGRSAGVRIVTHPDQFVVLNSERAEVRENSRRILAAEAAFLDLLELPQSATTAIILHGGKGGRADALVRAVRGLPKNIRSRLVLENDERTYGAADILAICQRASVPMVFDAHHHLVKERLSSYAHDSVAFFTAAAAATWPDPSMQLVHISNGRNALHDPRHSDTIAVMPPAFRRVPYIEVEAKAKEEAIFALRAWFPQKTRPQRRIG